MKRLIGFVCLAGLALLIIGTGVASAACTTIIVGKDLTKDGSVLIAHNEELGDDSCQHYAVYPAREGGDYALYSGGTVAEPATTNAYLTSQVFSKDYIPGDVTAGINEHQVAIFNNMAYSRWYPDDPWEVFPGGVIWTEFNQLALQAATSAREAVQIMGYLSETHQLSADPGTMFGIADPDEGWWIEIARGGRWAAVRVADDESSMRANCFRIGEIDFDDHENFMSSADLVDYAVAMGWYDPAAGPFEFASVYGSAASLANPYNTLRHEMVQWALDMSGPRIEKRDLMRILRWHYEGTEYDHSDGYATSPHATDVRTCCRTTTEVSVVAQLRDWMPAPIGGVMWMSLKTPCSSVYIPWYMGVTKVPKAFTIGTEQPTPGSAYWAFRDLVHMVDEDYAEAHGVVQHRWRIFERQLFKKQRTVERHALALYERSPKKALAYLTRYSGIQGKRSMNLALGLQLRVAALGD